MIDFDRWSLPEFLRTPYLMLPLLSLPFKAVHKPKFQSRSCTWDSSCAQQPREAHTRHRTHVHRPFDKALSEERDRWNKGLRVVRRSWHCCHLPLGEWLSKPRCQMESGVRGFRLGLLRACRACSGRRPCGELGRGSRWCAVRQGSWEYLGLRGRSLLAWLLRGVRRGLKGQPCEGLGRGSRCWSVRQER